MRVGSIARVFAVCCAVTLSGAIVFGYWLLMPACVLLALRYLRTRRTAGRGTSGTNDATFSDLVVLLPAATEEHAADTRLDAPRESGDAPATPLASSLLLLSLYGYAMAPFVPVAVRTPSAPPFAPHPSSLLAPLPFFLFSAIPFR